MNGTLTHAGGIVTRSGPDGVRYLLVRAKRDPTQWIYPKGHIEPGETAIQAAVREVGEEAGVRVDLGRHLGDLETDDGRIAMFLLYYVDDGPVAESREKTWCTFEEARQLLSFAGSRELLATAARVLETGA